MDIRESDIPYLESVEKKAFSPLGPLYTRLYEELLGRGLVHLAADGYIISEEGRAVLEARRSARRP